MCVGEDTGIIKNKLVWVDADDDDKEGGPLLPPFSFPLSLPPALPVHGVFVFSCLGTKEGKKRMYVIDERVILVSMRVCGGWHHTRKGREKMVEGLLCVYVVGKEGGWRRARGWRKGCDFFFCVCEEETKY